MALARQDVPRLFKAAVDDYLKSRKPKYRRGRFTISEKEIQKQFAIKLLDKNLPFRRERHYANPEHGKTDFQLYDDGLATYIEIEWEAKYTDGFAKRTFDDLKKLDHIPIREWGMFLAVNVGNKYKASSREASCIDASRFALSPKGKRTYLLKRWDESAPTSLLKCNSRFWRWPIQINGERFMVTILSCYGRRIGNRTWASA